MSSSNKKIYAKQILRIPKEKVSVDKLSERTQKKVGVGLLHGLHSNGKKIRKSILQFKDSKAIRSVGDANTATLSKADKAIADANEKSDNYLGELKASRAARHAKMMQRRKSGVKLEQKVRVKNDVRPKQLSSKGMRVVKSPKASDAVKKEFKKKKTIAQSIALEAEEDVERERDARKRHLQERLNKRKTKLGADQKN